MTKLIIYVNSEQNASAYRIEEDNSYSISFNGNEYESDLSTFAETVMEELRATPLSKMESRGGISVLLVSNGATNETIRRIMELLFHDDNEDGMLNVNIQELNVIEAKYFLPFIENPESPSSKDFIQFFDIENKVVADSNEIQELSKSIELKDKEIQDLSQFKEDVTKAIEKKLEERKALLENRKMQDCIHKIDFIHDTQWNDDIKFSPHHSEKVHFHRKMENGDKVSYGQIIGVYDQSSYAIPVGYKYINSASGRLLMAKTNGYLYYLVDDNKAVSHGEIVAVIGNFNSLEEAAGFVVNNS